MIDTPVGGGVKRVSNMEIIASFNVLKIIIKNI